MEHNEPTPIVNSEVAHKATPAAGAHHPYSKQLLVITSVIVVLAGVGSAYFLSSAKEMEKKSEEVAVTQATATPTATSEVTATPTPTPSATGTVDTKEEIKADVKALNDEVKAAITKMQAGF